MTAFLQPTPLTEMVSGAAVQCGQNKSQTCWGERVQRGLWFDQTFQISILWHPTIPIDRMTDIVAVALDLQTDDLNPQTTPDIRPNKSATAGNHHFFCFFFFKALRDC